MPNKILVVGDLILDNYLFGDADRISPEAPVPILKKIKLEPRLGGAGNLALNLKLAGNSVILMGFLGNDNEGILFSKLAKKNGIKLHTFEHISRTTTKTRIISDGQQIVRIDDESIKPFESHSLYQLFDKVIENCDLVILSDYDKGAIADPQTFINK